MSKTMKKIGSIFAAATLVGATLTGAIAADLKDLPAPFVKDGKADVTIVVGASAATADVLGSIDIASALQAKSVTKQSVNVPGAASKSISAGVKLESNAGAFLLGDALTVETKVDESDLEDLLADGMIVDEDGEDEEYEYSQELSFGNAAVVFDRPESSSLTPVANLNFVDASDGFAVEYTVDFDEAVDVDTTSTEGEGLDNSESIVMLGKSFTFDSTNPAGSELTLFGSDATEYLVLNEPKTFTVDGKSYTVEITGGNSDNDNVVIAVNGVSKTVSQRETQTINGLEIYAKDVFVTNIPTLSAAATVFIGSEEITIPAAAADADCAIAGDFEAIEVNGEDVDGLEVCVVNGGGADWAAVTEIVFRWTPDEMADEVEYLEAGDSVTMPLFESVQLLFEGPEVAYDSEDRETLNFYVSGDTYKVAFTNEDGDEYDIELFELVDADSMRLADDFARAGEVVGSVNVTIAASSPVEEDAIFIAQDGGSVPNQVTRVFQVTDVDASEDEVTFEDLSNGDSITVQVGEELADTGLYVRPTAAAGGTDIVGDSFFFSNAAANAGVATSGVIYTKNDVSVTLANLNAVAPANNQAVITVVEDAGSDIQDEASPDTLTITVNQDGTDEEYQVTTAWATASIVSDKDGDYDYAVTELGTYMVAETDEETEYVTLSVANQEVNYAVFVAPVDATVVSSGSTITTDVVNPIAVGSAVLDSSVSLASESKNLIVVGGPCANSVAAALLQTAADSCGAGFTPGSAVIQLFDTPMGKTAMLVAGYEATETQAASRAVAKFDSRLTGKSVKLTVTNVNDITVSSSQ